MKFGYNYIYSTYRRSKTISCTAVSSIIVQVPDTALFIPEQQWLTERRQCRTVPRTGLSALFIPDPQWLTERWQCRAVPRTGLSADFSHARSVTRHNRIPVLGKEDNAQITRVYASVPDLNLKVLKFLGLPDPELFVRIRILPPTSKKGENLDFYGCDFSWLWRVLYLR